MQLIIDLLAFLLPYGTLAYIFMFLLLLACGFGLPLPEDIVLITGGMLASHGVTNYWTTLAVCMAGVLIGDGIIHFSGRYMGDKIKSTKFFKYLIKNETDAKIQYWFSKYGDKMVFFARFMPGLRMALFMSSGIYKVSTWKFFILDGIAAVISVPLWIWIGFIFGSNLEVLESKIHQLKVGIYGVIGVVVLSILVYVFVKRKLENEIL